MQLATAPSVAPLAEPAPSSPGGDVLVATRVEAPIEGRRARDVTITPWVRLRSSLLLALTVLGIAAILGAVLSVVVVGIVFVAT